MNKNLTRFIKKHPMKRRHKILARFGFMPIQLFDDFFESFAEGNKILGRFLEEQTHFNEVVEAELDIKIKKEENENRGVYQ